MRFATHLLAATLLSMPIANPLFAQTGRPDSLLTDAARPLDEVVITANKFPQKQSQTGKVLTILTDSLLRANSGKSLTDLLNQQAGLTVVGSNQPLGSFQSVFMRGAAGGYTLILLDGVPLYDPSTTEGNFDLNFIPLDQIARVEILKGGQSTLYGSDAMAGVINIITTRAKPGLQLNGLLTAGSYGTFRRSIGLGGAVGKTTYQLSASRTTATGFSSAYDPTGAQNFDKDGFAQTTVRAGLTHRLTPKLMASVSGLYSAYRADIDGGAFVDDRDYTTRNLTRQLGGSLDYTLSRGRIVLTYRINQSERNYLDDSTYVPKNAFSTFIQSRYGAVSHVGEVYTNLSLSGALELVAGLDYRAQNTTQTYVSYSQYGKYEADPISAAQAQINMVSGFASLILKNTGGFGAEVGGRLNRHSVYGGNTTYTVNPYYTVGRLKLLANVSSSFKDPSLYYLYSPYGNRDLKPETATTYEAGAQLFGSRQQTYIRAVYFKRDVRDVVFFQSLDTEPYGRYINLNRQQDEGLELDLAYRTGKLQLTGNYTYLTGAVTTLTQARRDTSYNNLLRRPKHSVTATLSYAILPKLTLSATGRVVGQRLDAVYNEQTFATNVVTLTAYTTLDVYAAYRVARRVNVFADLRNITNGQYFELAGFTSRRFNGTVGVVFSL